MEISVAVGLAMAIGFSIMSWYNLQVERKRSIAREKELLAAIKAKDLKDYIDAVDDLEKTPADKLKQTKAEQDLAIEYEKANKVAQGIPVT
jgi:hypothetical protein